MRNELLLETCRDTSVQIVIGLMHNKISQRPIGALHMLPAIIVQSIEWMGGLYKICIIYIES